MTRREAIRIFILDADVLEGGHGMPVIFHGLLAQEAMKFLALDRADQLLLLRNKNLVLKELEL